MLGNMIYFLVGYSLISDSLHQQLQILVVVTLRSRA